MRNASSGLACLILAGLLSLGSAHAQSSWVSAGKVSVLGKTIPKAHFLKNGREYVFPVLALASGLGKKASFDAASRTITWEGQSSTPASLVVVDGQPYLSYKELLKLDSSLEYGLSSEQATFYVKLVPNQIELPSDYASIPIMVVNEKTPGALIPKLETFAVKGKYTLCEMFSEACPPCRSWAPVLQRIALRNAEVRVRRFDINRPGTPGIDYGSPLARQGKLDHVPAFYLIDPEGRVIGRDDDKTLKQVITWAHAAGMSDADLRAAGVVR
jgi:hypothetical protein